MTEIAFMPATELLQAIRAKQIGCLEALDSFLDRIERINPEVNAIISFNIQKARELSHKADEALAQGENWGVLHGLPMTVKDVFEVKGMPTTAGAQLFRNHHPNRNADIVEKLVSNGAIIFGKTNLSEYAADWQSDNQVYGRTNNPWDFTKTPGGSSGGPAAALASGMTPLEIGSDMCGSMRIPAHYCGVYSHRSTYGIVSLRGHIPGVPGKLSQSDLASAGPMSLCADDLELALDVISGPPSPENIGWSLSLPDKRRNHLKDFRIATWFSDDFCRIDPELEEQYQRLVTFFKKRGIKIYELSSKEISLQEIYELCLVLAGGVMGQGLAPIQSLGVRLSLAALKPLRNLSPFSNGLDVYYGGMIQSHSDWLKAHEKRTRMRLFFSRFFEKFDVLLTPITPWTALPHMNHSSSSFIRTSLDVNGEKRNYIDHIPWISIATLLGLPATSAPIGKSSGNLPINIQIIGGPYCDKTTIDFARKLEKITGGFKPPAGLA